MQDELDSYINLQKLIFTSRDTYLHWVGGFFFRPVWMSHFTKSIKLLLSADICCVYIFRCELTLRECINSVLLGLTEVQVRILRSWLYLLTCGLYDSSFGINAIITGCASCGMIKILRPVKLTMQAFMLKIWNFYYHITS